MSFIQDPAVEDPDEAVLDKLEELSIIGIDESRRDSPASAATSLLPTPPVPHAPFNAQPYKGHVQIWSDFEVDDEPMPVPGAPLLKDMDSFSQGSAAGDFDDLPEWKPDDEGGYEYPANEISLSLLPPVEPDWIDRWRAEVLEDTFLPMKRRRSPSPEIERPPAKRTRPRIRATSLPVQHRSFTDDIGFPTARSEPDVPD